MAIRLGDSGNNSLVGSDVTAFSLARVNVGPAGAQANANSYGAIFTPDGGKLAFYSYASNLAVGDTNGAHDAFLADLATGAVTRLVPTAFTPGAVTALWGDQQLGRHMAFSADGTKAAFVADDAGGLAAGDSNGKVDVFWADLVTGEVRLVSRGVAGAQANDDSYYAEISADGSKVTYTSYATNLISGDTNRSPDIFVYDVAGSSTTRVSTTSTGVAANRGSALGVFSPDGTLMAFQSAGSNLVAGDTNLKQDIFLKNLVTGAVTMLSTDSAGAPGTLDSTHPVFSEDGQWVVFQSSAALLAADTNIETDVYARNVVTGELRMLTTDAAGQPLTTGDSTHGVLSADNTKLVFQSNVAFSPTDANNNTDVFVKDLLTGEVTLISATPTGATGAGNSNHPVFSPDGTKVAFMSNVANLVGGDTNRMYDIFVATLANTGNDSLAGGGGDDSIQGRSGDDTMDGGAGNDVMDGGTGLDTASYASATAGIRISLASTRAQATGGAGTDTLLNIENVQGSAWGDTITGSDGANLIDGGAGGDVLLGGAGNDTMLGGAGVDRLTGGTGADVFRFDLLADSGADATGRDRILDFSSAEGDRIDLTRIDAALTMVSRFTHHAHELTQTVSAAGVTVMVDVDGDGATDFSLLVNGSVPLATTDFVAFAPPPPPTDMTLNGTAGNDILLGLAGRDLLAGGAGDDVLDGGAGLDTASYAGAVAGVRVSLAITRAQATMGDGTDTLTNVENLLGSAWNDTLSGDDNANLLDGAGGADMLLAAGGNDTLVGGAGPDRLTGGTGADVFRFTQASDSGADALTRDRVIDFSSAEGDKLDLHLVDPALALVAAFDGHAHQLVQSVIAAGILVTVDVDGNGVADFSLLVNGTAPLAASDFIL